jgi:nucleoside-diphosphate-sugar epimerase
MKKSKKADLSTTHRICILGAGGAIGSYLAIYFHNLGYEVVAVVRTLNSAMRIGRYPLRIRSLDILKTDVSVLIEMFEDIETVIDCTFSAGMNVDETIRDSEALAEKIISASNHAKVSTLIHYGTISVYPETSAPVDENTVCEFKNNPYADGKLAAERLLLNFESSTNVIVLQLPIVIGPYLGWTQRTFSMMVNNRLSFPSPIQGHCSPIDVSDVALATKLAIDTYKAQDSQYQRFLIHADIELSWEEYFLAYSELDESLRVEILSRDEFENRLQLQNRQNTAWSVLKSKFSQDGDFRQLMLSQRGIKSIYSVAKRISGQSGMDQIKGRLATGIPASDTAIVLKNIDSRLLNTLDVMPKIDSSKAKNVLGFESHLSFSQSMKVIGQWAKWARII